MEIDSSIADVHYNLGNAYSLQGKTTKAIPCYQRAIELKPGKSENYYNLGNAYCTVK
jgi:tetratricopeptide (TPR) repeat protein